MSNNLVKYSILLLLCLLHVNVSAQISSGGSPLPYKHPQPSEKARKVVATESVTNFYYKLPVDTNKTLPENNLRVLYTGTVCNVDLSPTNSGTTFTTEDGTNIWRVGMYSPNAASISLIFSEFNVPDGAKLFLYNPSQTIVYGAFTSANNNSHNTLPIRPLDNDTIVIEYQEPMDAAFKGSLKIGSAVHNFESSTSATRKVRQFYYAERCSPHTSVWEGAEPIKRSVCILYATGTSSAWWGTANLINNADKHPYIYTAAHNVDETNVEHHVIWYFNYEVPAKDTLVQGSEEFTMASSEVIARDFTLDFALLELNQMPPKDYRPYLAGWNLTASPTPPLTCIQHPQGDTKRISQTTNAPVISTLDGDILNPVQNSFWRINRWQKGTTEPGSSGSALLDNNGYIIGALTGGNSTCDSPVLDYFSRISYAWDYYQDASKQLKIWLDPYNTGITQMDGADPYENSHPCARTNNYTDTDEMSIIYIGNGISGLLAGHNSLEHTAFAEKFSFDEDKLLYGAYVVPCIGKYNSSAPVYLNIYNGTDVPEDIIGSAQIHPQDLTFVRGELGTKDKVTLTKKENYIKFDTPIKVGKTFFVGCQIQYAQIDSFGIYAVENRTINNSAFYQDDNGWHSYTEHSYMPTNTSLWIEPVVCFDDISSVQNVNDNASNNFLVSPNPTSDKIQWESTNNEIGDEVYFELFDIQGRLCNFGKSTLVQMPPAKGIYILRLIDGINTEVHKIIRK